MFEELRFLQDPALTMEQLEEVTSEDWGFKLAFAKEINLFDEIDIENFKDQELTLLALNQSIFVASNLKKLVYGSLSIDYESDNIQKTELNISGVTQLYFNHAGTILYYLKNNNLYSIAKDSLSSIETDSSLLNSDITHFIPSPYSDDILSLKSGSLYFNNDLVESTLAFSWGENNYFYIKFDSIVSSTNETISFTTPDEFHIHDFIYLSNNRFLIMFESDESDLDNHDVQAVIYDNGTSYNADLAPPFGFMGRKLQYYKTQLNNWIPNEFISFITSSCSSDISTLSISPLKSIIQSEDTNRAQFPLNDGDDTTPLGFALDLSRNDYLVKQVVAGVDESLGKLPILYSLLNNGQLIAWWIYNKTELMNDNVSLESAKEILKVEGTSPQSANAEVESENLKTNTSSADSNPFGNSDPFSKLKLEKSVNDSLSGSFGNDADSSKSAFGSFGKGTESNTGAFGSLGKSESFNSGFGSINKSAVSSTGAFGSFGKSVQSSTGAFGSFGKSTDLAKSSTNFVNKTSSSSLNSEAFGATGFGQLSSGSGFGQTSFGQQNSGSGSVFGGPAFGSSGFGKSTATSGFGKMTSGGGFGSLTSSTAQSPFSKLSEKKSDSIDIFNLNAGIKSPTDSKPSDSLFGNTTLNDSSFVKLANQAGKALDSPFSKFSGESKPTDSPFSKFSGESKPTDSPFSKFSGNAKPIESPFGKVASESKLVDGPFGKLSGHSNLIDSPFGKSMNQSVLTGSPFGKFSDQSKLKESTPNITSNPLKVSSDQSKSQFDTSDSDTSSTGSGDVSQRSSFSYSGEVNDSPNTMRIEKEAEEETKPLENKSESPFGNLLKPLPQPNTLKTPGSSTNSSFSNFGKSFGETLDLSEPALANTANSSSHLPNIRNNLQTERSESQQSLLSDSKPDSKPSEVFEKPLDGLFGTIETPSKQNTPDVGVSTQLPKTKTFNSETESKDSDSEDEDDNESDLSDDEEFNNTKVLESRQPDTHTYFLSFNGLTSSRFQASDKISQEILNIINQTSGQLHVLDENIKLFDKKLKYQESATTEMTLDALKLSDKWVLNDDGTKLIKIKKDAFNLHIKDSEPLLEELETVVTKLEENQSLRVRTDLIFNQLRELTSEVSSKKVSSRKLDLPNFILKERLRSKLAKVKKQEEELRLKLMSLKAKKSPTSEMVANLESIIIQLYGNIVKHEKSMTELSSQVDALDVKDQKLLTLKEHNQGIKARFSLIQSHSSTKVTAQKVQFS